jgi:hypothetical protein
MVGSRADTSQMTIAERESDAISSVPPEQQGAADGDLQVQVPAGLETEPGVIVRLLAPGE